MPEIANWKWEGYAEYIARQNGEQNDLLKNIARLIEADKANKKSWEINFSDGTMAPREYYAYWLLMQFCIDVKKMNYSQILNDKTEEDTVRRQLINWYKQQVE